MSGVSRQIVVVYEIFSEGKGGVLKFSMSGLEKALCAGDN
jgi:hypothetical protein